MNELNNNFYSPVRMRRLRYHPVMRDLVSETRLSINDLVAPVFVIHGAAKKLPIKSMPGFFQFSLDLLKSEIDEITALGIKAIIIFGIPEQKDELGSDSYDDNGIVQQAIKKIKSINPNLLIISDVCFCQYTSLGHCGVVVEHDHDILVDNDKTLKFLAKQALSHAKAGADVIAPSGMMDHMVKHIRFVLDHNNFTHIPILSYAIKYRSSMYGPFAEAAHGAAKIGDRKTYQMDFANSNEAIREAMLDIEEGADIIMIKPAHTYLDIIYKVKQQFPFIPVAAYHPSGEYMLIKAAASQGYINYQASILEVVTAIKRAGASLIITYFAKDLASLV